MYQVSGRAQRGTLGEQQPVLRECEVKAALVHCWQKRKPSQPLWNPVEMFLNKAETRPSLQPAVLLLSIYQKDSKLTYLRDMCTLVSAAPFTVAKLWNEPTCPATEEWTFVCGQDRIFFSHK